MPGRAHALSCLDVIALDLRSSIALRSILIDCGQDVLFSDLLVVSDLPLIDHYNPQNKLTCLVLNILPCRFASSISKRKHTHRHMNTSTPTLSQYNWKCAQLRKKDCSRNPAISIVMAQLRMLSRPYAIFNAYGPGILPRIDNFRIEFTGAMYAAHSQRIGGACLPGNCFCVH